jgi:hypothetical protein
MTRDQRKKQRERMYAAVLAEGLSVAWSFEASEAPDFIVKDGCYKFGLEVRNIFGDKEEKNGSQAARGEATRQSRVNALRTAYEAVHPVPLVVKITGNLEMLDRDDFIAALDHSGIHDRPPAHQEVLTITQGIKVFLTRGTERADWYFLPDRIGWVNTNVQDLVNAAISGKAKRRLRYAAHCGDDVRLLLVADGIMKSGKLRVMNGAFDHQGFSKIYLLNYPRDVTVLSRSNFGDFLFVAG